MSNTLETDDIWSKEGIYSRLLQQLPPWWGTIHPVLDILLQSFITTGFLNYQQFFYVFLQLRIQTATGNNLDLISRDYFGGALPRKSSGENDTSFRNRILATLLQEKSTRYGMDNSLFRLTGFHPRIFEPWNPLDTGGYDVPVMGYSTAGYYGSGAYPAEVFIDVYVNAYGNMANYSGYNDYFFGYSVYGGLAQGWYGGESLINRVIGDQDIYSTINLTKPEGVKCWVAIHPAIL